MRRISILALLLLLGALPARPQSGFTVVSATPIKDPSGVPYVNCKGSASFVPSPSATQQALISGSTFQTDVPISSCDSFGNMTITLVDNSLVTDGHTGSPASQWRINISSQDGKTNFFCLISTAGNTQDITAAIQACAAPLPSSGGGSGAFSYTTLTSSPTPVFNATTNTGYSFTLTSNAVATFGTPNAGTIYQLNLCENGVGGFTFTFPGNVVLPTGYSLNTAALACTQVAFIYDGTKWQPWNTPGSVSPAGASGDLQLNFGGILGPAHINDSGGILSLTEPFSTTSGGTLTGAVGGTPTFGPLGNEALKPLTNKLVQFVSVFGNDSNDGLSWGTAKRTIYAALLSLPGGTNAGGAALTAGKGTVKVMDGGGTCAGLATDGVTGNSVQAGLNSGASGTGIWLMGSSDPNFASPPTGWLKYSGPIAFIGEAGSCNPSQSRQAQMVDVFAGAVGANRSSTRPGVWISGVSGSLRFENLAFANAWNGVRLGIDSNGNRTTTGAQGITFRNVSAAAGTFETGEGPTVDIGRNVFWVWFEGCTFSPNSTAAVNTDNRANIVINASGAGGTASGLITVKDSIWNGGGGIKYYTAGGVASLMVDNLTIEGSSGHGQPAVWLPAPVVGGTNVEITVKAAFLADYSDFVPAVQVDGQLSPSQVHVSSSEGQGASVIGPATVTGIGGIQFTSTQSFSPALYTQAGFFSSSFNTARVYGQQDTLRRSFSPVNVRFANIVPQLPSAWTNGTGTPTITTGIAALDGTTNAGRVSGVGISNIRFYSASRTTTVGDWVIAGVWARSNTANGFNPGPAPAAVGISSGTNCSLSGLPLGGCSVNLSQFISGDGEWDWYVVAFKITAVSGGTGIVQFTGNADSTHTADFYAPILLHIPNGTISDNEATEMAMHLVSYPETFAAADVGMLRGHNLNLTGSTITISPALSVPNGGSGLSTATTNGILFGNGTSAFGVSAAGGAGTLCLTETNGGVPIFGSCSGSTSTAWSSLTAPGADLSLNMSTFNSLFTHGVMTGTRNAWEIADGNSTSTGSLFNLHTGASSTMKPLTVTAQGTANGVQMSSVGVLAKLGTGSISADVFTGLATVPVGGTGQTTLPANQLLSGNGTSAVQSVAGSTTGTNPILKLQPSNAANTALILDTAATPSGDIQDWNINGVKTSWMDSAAVLHTPQATYTGSGPLALSGNAGTCPATGAGLYILCIADSVTSTIVTSLNGANFKPLVQSFNANPVAHAPALWGTTFPQQTSAASAGTIGQAFLSAGASADGGFGALNLAGGSTIFTGNLPTTNGGTGAASLSAANIVTVNGAITIGHCAQFQNTTVVQDSGGTCGGAGGAPPLHTITAATATNTINSTTFAQTWNWALTGSTTAFKFGENTAATGAGNVLLQASTAASSTAIPFQTDNNGNGYQLGSTGLWKPLGTGAIATPGAAHNLVVSQAGSAAVTYVPPVAAGKVLIDNGPGNDPSFQDPIVSLNTVVLFSTISATGTQTSTAQRVSTFSQYGTFFITFASITGSPSGCTLQVKAGDSAGNLINNGGTVGLSVANGTAQTVFNATIITAFEMQVVYACSVYPSTGTLTLEFSPAIHTNTNVTSLGSNLIDTNSGNKSGGTQRMVLATDQPNLTTPLNVALAANQSTNVAQLAGTTTDTNSGNKSAGTLRVVIATDQPQLTNKLLVTPDSVALPANQSVNVSQVAGTTTDTNSGNKSAGTQRNVLATDSPAIANYGHGATGSATPANGVLQGITDGTNLRGERGDANGRPFAILYPDTTTTSYHTSKKFAASSTTDNAVMPGNATNTVILTKVTVTCTQTTAGILNVELLKRSAADTGGTSAAMTAVPDDSNYAAAVSAPLSYTGTGPSVGAAVGDLDNAQVGCMAAATASANDIYVFKPAKPIVLRGTAQQVAVNLGGAVTGGNITVTFDWLETTTP